MDSIYTINPMIPLIISFFSCILYAGIFQFGYNRIIEKLYVWVEGSSTFKIQTYLFLINLPFILLIVFGLISNKSIITLDTSLKIDSTFILLVFSYICYLQQSRQTPLRGFVVLKDSIVLVISILILAKIEMQGTQTLSIHVLMIPLYLLHLILQAFTNEIEEKLLLLLGFRQKNTYKAIYLLTEKSHPSNFLEIKDIISTHEQKIQEQLQDYDRIANLMKRSKEELEILNNFAKLFIPIKTAYEIHQQLNKERSKKQYEKRWQTKHQHQFQAQAQHNQEQESCSKGVSFNQSASTLFVKRTFTNDSIFQVEDFSERKEQDQTLIYKIIKYVCYPLFLSVQITGRFRYFMDYLIVILLIVTMYFLAGSLASLSSSFAGNRNIISLVYSLILSYPTGSYFIRLSAGANDYDFLGIFMQSLIFKLMIFSITMVLQNFFSNVNLVESGKSLFISQVIRIFSFFLMGCYLTWKRFAMRNSNFKIFSIIYICAQLLKIIQQNVIYHI